MERNLFARFGDDPFQKHSGKWIQLMDARYIYPPFGEEYPPPNPTTFNLSLSDIRHYPLSFVYISMGRENFLSVKLNQLRLQLSLAVKLLLQSLCLKLANSLSLPLLTNEYKKTTNTNLLVSSSLPLSLLASPRNKPGLPLDLPNGKGVQCSQEVASLFPLDLAVIAKIYFAWIQMSSRWV